MNKTTGTKRGVPAKISECGLCMKPGINSGWCDYHYAQRRNEEPIWMDWLDERPSRTTIVLSHRWGEFDLGGAVIYL